LEDDCEYPNKKAFYKLTENDKEIGELRLGGNGGAQSVIYGVHPDGMQYEIPVPKPALVISLADLGDLAPGVVLHNTAPDPPAAKSSSPGVSDASLDERIRKYLDQVTPAIQGERGSNPTFRVACILINGFALPRDQTLKWMRYYSQKCDPPWSEKELEHKVDSALEAPHHKPRGYLLNGEPARQTTVQQSDATFPRIYYDHHVKDYWVQNDRDGWIKIHEGNVKRRLKDAGFKAEAQEGEMISEIDSAFIKIQSSHDVDYAGSLAGYHCGIHECCGHRILVKDSPQLITPCPGEWRNIGQIIKNMLGPEQSIFLFGWLKVAVSSLYSHTIRPGQALVFVGPKDCGKSLIQNHVITPLLGGRCAKPFPYMAEKTQFNGELLEAEHLIIEDEQASTDIRSRRLFGAKIKDYTANENQRCHAKGRTAITLTPFTRLSISINDEPENLMVLPPMDDSLEDKLIILKAEKHPMPMDTVTELQRQKFIEGIHSELPAFAHFLMNWEIPAELISQRYGITHYQNLEILDKLAEAAPETKLLELIDDDIFCAHRACWSGTAAELQRHLTRDGGPVRDEARQLLGGFQFSTGTYLGRLSRDYPERFKQNRTAKKRTWTLYPKPAAVIESPGEQQAVNL